MSRVIGTVIGVCCVIVLLALSLGAAIMAVRWCWAQVVG